MTPRPVDEERNCYSTLFVNDHCQHCGDHGKCRCKRCLLRDAGIMRGEGSNR